MDFSNDRFSFTLKTDLRFGVGEANRLPEYLRQLGWKNIAVIVDAGPAATTTWCAIHDALNEEFNVISYFETDVSEPTYDYLDAVCPRFAGKAIDGFVIVGGGSILDLGKAISILLTNPGPAIRYRGFDMVKNPGPPIIAIPTTAGTGSEITPNAVFVDTKEQRKFGINTSLYLPKMCILDPILTVSCPKSVTISSGMDALVHAHESFVSKKATPVTRLLSIEAFRLVYNSLPLVVERPDNLEMRSRMLLGSYFAAAALFNSSAGPAGAMSYPLGVHQRVAHGLAGAVFLARVVQHNVDHGYAGYGPLYQQIVGVQPIKDDIEASRQFAKNILSLCNRLGIPRTLDPFGFKHSHIGRFLEQVQFLRGAFEMNPVEFTLEDVRRTLEEMTPA